MRFGGAWGPAAPPAVPVIAYVPLTVRSLANALLRGQPPRTAVVSAAAAWAGPPSTGGSRLGLLMDGRLILCNSGGQALAMDLELPMFAKTVPLAGTYVGRVGSRIGLLQADQLRIWQLAPGAPESFSRLFRGSRTRSPSLRVALDGSFAYVTGSHGIQCFNLATQTESFQSPWPPAALAKERGAPPQRLYTLHGVLVSRPHTGWTPGATVRGFTADRTLFTLSAPNRVVALDDLPLDEAVPPEGGDPLGR